jgi:hypothetical protein
MKTTMFFAVAIAALTSIPLLAQELAGDAAKTTYAPANGGWGDAAASHAWEMSSITGELQGKLDSGTAKPGDRVVLKTTDKVQTSDGTVIPRGSRLIGHVTEVQAYDSTHGISQMGIAFDHVELKDGKSVAIFTLIRRLYPGAIPISASGSAMGSDDPMDASMGAQAGGGRMGPQSSMGGGRAGGTLGSGGGTLNGGGLAGGANNTADSGIGTIGDRANAGLGASQNGAVQSAGLGDADMHSGAHAAAAARAMPRPSGIPGVMLAGNSTASGLLIAAKKNIEFAGGTQMQLGIVAN